MKYVILFESIFVVCFLQSGNCGIFNIFPVKPKVPNQIYLKFDERLKELLQTKTEFQNIIRTAVNKLGSDPSKATIATLWMNSTLREVVASSEQEVQAFKLFNLIQIGFMAHSDRIQGAFQLFNNSNEGMDGLIKEIGTKIAAVIDATNASEAKDTKYVKLIHAVYDPLVVGISNYGCEVRVAAIRINDILAKDNSISVKDANRIIQLLIPITRPDKAKDGKALLEQLQELI